MIKFNIGDRVSVYGYLSHGIIKGTVEKLDYDCLVVKTDPNYCFIGYSETISPHFKQCRKLTKKIQRRIVWLVQSDHGVFWNKVFDSEALASGCTDYEGISIKFIEVRRKND